jgi:hypothetical protein
MECGISLSEILESVEVSDRYDGAGIKDVASAVE